MKRHLAIAVLALTVLNGVAFADTPDASGRGDGMSAPTGTKSDDRTRFVPVPGQEGAPAPYGLINDPARTYYFAP
jgi:hypothetical protein